LVIVGELTETLHMLFTMALKTPCSRTVILAYRYYRSTVENKPTCSNPRDR